MIKINREDSLFSNYIRERDGWKCVSCKTQYHPPTKGLHCSHYISRRNWGTRFDPDNCDALCYYCHMRWGGDYRANYTEFKKKQLGEKRYNQLILRANSYCKKDRKMALMYVKELIENQKKII